jgi:pyrophosphatase PpaX
MGIKSMIDISSKELVIFDFDGTIADTLPLCFETFRQTFQYYNNETLSDNQIEALFGSSEESIIRKRLSNKSEKTILEAIDYYFEVYEARHDEYLSEIDHRILQTIKKIASKKKVAIFTGKGKRGLSISLDKLGYSNVFNYIVSDDDVNKSKPHPEGLNKIVDLFKINRSKCVFFGDSEADIKSGIAAGIETIGVNWFRNNIFKVNPKCISYDISDLKY